MLEDKLRFSVEMFGESRIGASLVRKRWSIIDSNPIQKDRAVEFRLWLANHRVLGVERINVNEGSLVPPPRLPPVPEAI